jgi:nitrous oxidase accessory protein NosD
MGSTRSRTRLFAFALAVAAAAFAVFAGLAKASTLHVCPVSCPFTTIQSAVNAANPNDTIVVDAGVYSENVTVNKPLTLQGAEAGVDARTRSGAETIVDGTGNSGRTPFSVTANDVTIDGFTVQGATSGNQFGYGVLLGAGTSGAHIVNDILQNNISAIGLANASASDQRSSSTTC